MAVKISALNALAGVDIDAADLLPIVDDSASETKRVTIASLRTGVVTATAVAAAGGVLDSNFAGTALGRLVRVGTGDYAVIRDNLTASAAPTAGDDDADGYEVGSLWLWAARGALYVCTSATTGAATWAQVGPDRPAIVVDTSTARAMGDADHGRLVAFSDNVGPCVVTVPTGLTAGTVAQYVQTGDGQVQIAAGVGMNLIKPAAFLTRAAQKGSPIVITVLDSTNALVSGDLEAA